MTDDGYSLPRQLTPRASRTNTRPREFTVTRPARLEADTPLPDTLTHWLRPARTRRRNTNPMRPSVHLPADRG